ncbi:MAG: Peptidase protein [Actinomycetota bacterium]|nr:Peptidase protein [Actinomycetota bacterium]
MKGSRSVGALGVAVLAAALALAPVPAGASDVGSTAVASAVAATRADDSPLLDTDAERPSEGQVRAEVTPGEAVQIGVASTDGDGGLAISTVAAVGPEQALAAIAAAVDAPDTVAVGLPQTTELFGSVTPAANPTAATDPAATVPPAATDPYRVENAPLPMPYYQYSLDMLCADPIADAQTRYPCDGYDWQYATGKGQVVAIIDQGVATSHPDLAASIVPGARCLDVSNGACQPVAGTAPNEVSMHGTHVAGIVNAVNNNGIGVSGLAKDAKLMPVQVISPTGTGNTTDLAAGIVWALDNGATVLNMSLGSIGAPSDPVLAAAIAESLRLGVPVVAAVGNDGPSNNRVAYPAAYNGVIGVANVDNTKTVADSSSRGYWVDVAAPGTLVISTVNTTDPTWGPYGWATGTSMATPQVSAMVAMLRQRQPSMTPAQLATLVTSTAEDRGATGWDSAYGFGIVRPLTALKSAVVPPPAAVGSTFVPINPARVLNTRTSVPIAGRSARTVSVASEIDAAGAVIGEVVPVGASAIAYNLTVPAPPTAGHLRVMPGDTAYSSASAINFTAGQTIANGLMVKIDGNRQVRLFNATGLPVHALLDVVGYFVPTNSQLPAGSRFTPIPPVRVYDAAAPGSTLLGPDETRTISVTTGLEGQQNVVPAGATAVAYNITVVEPGISGHLRVMPGDVAETGSSAINWFLPQDKIANGLVVRVAANRTVNVYNSAGVPVRFLLDIVGYYGASGALFYPIAPARVYDSRQPLPQQGALPPIGVRTVYVGDGRDAVGAVTSTNVVPVGATALAYNVTVPMPATSTGGHLRVWPANQTMPKASAINWPVTGATTRANGLQVGLPPDRKVSVYNGSADSNNVIIDALGYYK